MLRHKRLTHTLHWVVLFGEYIEDVRLDQHFRVNKIAVDFNDGFGQPFDKSHDTVFMWFAIDEEEPGNLLFHVITAGASMRTTKEDLILISTRYCKPGACL